MPDTRTEQLAELERLEELNRKRTPGEWRSSTRSSLNSGWQVIESLAGERIVETGDEPFESAEREHDRANSYFIAALANACEPSNPNNLLAAAKRGLEAEIHERQKHLLGDSLLAVLVRAGVLGQGAECTGPELLSAAESYCKSSDTPSVVSADAMELIVKAESDYRDSGMYDVADAIAAARQAQEKTP